MKFLGVVSEVYYRLEEGELIYLQEHRAIEEFKVLTKVMINLGIVYKASTVLETVDELLKIRGVKRD